jgi:hypothetical protein
LQRAASAVFVSWSAACSFVALRDSGPSSSSVRGGLRAVEVPVGDNRALVRAPGAAVVGVQVLDQGGAGGAENDPRWNR